MSELDDQIQHRRDKRQRLADAGIAVYPHRFDWDLEPAGVHERHGERSAEDLDATAIQLRVPGRVQAIREHGKSAFLDLGDGRGKLQLLVRKDQLPPASRQVLDNLDLGDLVGAVGQLMRTRTGELSLRAGELVLLAKALRPLPEKWHGLADVEARYRQRYLDLATSPESRRVFEVRAALIAGIREFLDARGFLEVETPMMQVLAGGAAARPFRTHHNALDLDLYLRIAPELYLKRLLVGGMPRVYEINRNFRNEGISTRHNPEFTMLEFYAAYADYRDMMTWTEELLTGLAARALPLLGVQEITYGGVALDLTRPWRRFGLREAVAHFGGVAAERLEDAVGVAAELAARRLPVPPGGSYGHLLMALFEHLVEPHLVQPTFVEDYPVEVSPLSKQREDDPRFTERFELYLGGMEIANGFSELNDPDVQAERFRQQLAARQRGDAEAHLFDHDYVRALEHGMPPAGGEGIGIDRLTMLFADRPSIRDVILFPLLRPETASQGAPGTPGAPAPAEAPRPGVPGADALVADALAGPPAGQPAAPASPSEGEADTSPPPASAVGSAAAGSAAAGTPDGTATADTEVAGRSSKLLLRNLPLPLTLALRYVRSTRRDAFASFLSAVAGGGIALGVAALVLSLAVISGFQEALRAELLGRTPQILVDLPPGLDLAAARAARDTARRVPGATGAQLQVRGGGWVVDQGKVHAVELIGFEGRVPRSFPGVDGAPEGLYLPASLAARWGLAPGRPITLVSPRPTLTPLGPQPRLRTLPLTGTYRSGRTQEERERVALPRAVAETLLGGTERQVEVEAASLDAALAVAARLGPRLPPGSEVRTWKELNRPLLFALRLEKVMMFVAVSLIVLVASLALVADLALIISSKRAEIGILATMGTTPAALRRTFVLLGGVVTAIGILAGLVLGVGGALVLDRYRLVPVPGRVYFLDYVPFLVKPLDLALVLLLTLGLALASALYAAQRAATLDPIEALKR